MPVPGSRSFLHLSPSSSVKCLLQFDLTTNLILRTHTFSWFYSTIALGPYTTDMEHLLPSQSTFIPILENFHEVLQAIMVLG
jgi:hypothetical protein